MTHEEPISHQERSEDAPGVSTPVSYEEFVSVANEQGVQLERGLSDSAKPCAKFATPTAILGAARYAGWTLMKRPDVCLSTGLIAVPPHWENDVPAMTLLGFLNGRHRPPENGSGHTTNIEVDETWHLPSCTKVEPYFAKTYIRMLGIGDPSFCDALNTTDEELFGNCQIILGDDGKPVAVRKDVGFNSLLVVGDLMINGLPVPPGYLLSANVHSKERLVGSECVTAASLLRLTGYALPPKYRSSFVESAKQLKASPKVRYTVGHARIEFIADRVDRVAAILRERDSYCCASAHPVGMHQTNSSGHNPVEVEAERIKNTASIGSVAETLGEAAGYLPGVVEEIHSRIQIIDQRIEDLRSGTKVDSDRWTRIDFLLRARDHLIGAAVNLANNSPNDVAELIFTYIDSIGGRY